MPKQSIRSAFYAVRRGHNIGVYKTWAQCKAQVDGFSGAQYRKFETYEDAQTFIKGSTSVAKLTTQPKAAETLTTKTEVAKVEAKALVKADEVVYTDGAASNNGNKGAKAGYGVFWGDSDPRNEGGPLEGIKQTNQRGELRAVVRALEQSMLGRGTLEVRTDSQYTINCVENWCKKWIKNGWKGSTGKAVDNRDLVERILDLRKNRPGKVWLTYVAGHSGDYGNDKADQLAVEGARLGAVVKKL